jgi:hypothetical protein
LGSFRDVLARAQNVLEPADRDMISATFGQNILGPATRPLKTISATKSAHRD